MTDERHTSEEPNDDIPLDPWMLSLAHEATDVDDDAIPREMMWARLQQQRRQPLMATTDANASATPTATSANVLHFERATPVSARRNWMVRSAGIAALIVGGIGVGRYLLPATGPSKYQTAVVASAVRADSIRALGFGPEAMEALPPSSEPVHVAMEEHLARTVALLTTVRDHDAEEGPGADLDAWARELLGTTRLLMDEPQLRDERTRRLLQDLELVLAQIIQVRRSAPETKRAPTETMRETNLLPRVRAAVTASRRGDEPTYGGGL